VLKIERRKINREEKNNLRKRIENRKKRRKELSPLLAILTMLTLRITHSCLE